MCSTDGEYSQVWNEETVRARKAHRCDDCYLSILPGEMYVRIGSLYDGHWETLRQHAGCKAVAEFVRKHICEANGEKGFIPVAGLDQEIIDLRGYGDQQVGEEEAADLAAMGIELETWDEGEDLPAPQRSSNFRAVAEWVWDLAKDGHPQYKRMGAP